MHSVLLLLLLPFANRVKFADSWSGSGGAENAPLLAKQIDTFSTVELLFNISKLA